MTNLFEGRWMSFTKLLTAIKEGKTEEATELAGGLETDFNANVGEITKLENKANEAIQGRDKTKTLLRSLAEEAGVDSLTVNTLKELKSKRGDDSELEAGYKTQIKELEGKLQTMEGDYTGKLSNLSATNNDLIIDRELSNMGVGKDAISDAAKGDIIKHLKNGVVIEEGKIVYNDENGNPIRNDSGRPIAVEDKIASLRTDRAYLFKAQGKGGSGEQHQSSGGDTTLKRSEMSHSQKGAFIAEKGDEAYYKLHK